MLFAPKVRNLTNREDTNLIMDASTLEHKNAVVDVLLYGEFVRGHAQGDASPDDFKTWLRKHNAEKTEAEISYIYGDKN